MDQLLDQPQSQPTRKSWHRPRNLALAIGLTVFATAGWIIWECLKVAAAEPVGGGTHHAEHRTKWLEHTDCDEDANIRAWTRVEEVVEQFASICLAAAKESPDVEVPVVTPIDQALYGDDPVVRWSDIEESPETH